MGNVTSDLIETAIQSADNDTDSCVAHTIEPSISQLLREKMEDIDHDQKNTTVLTTNVTPVPLKEPVMMAPKKKFLIGYRGGTDDDPANKETVSSETSGVDVSKASSKSLSVLAEVARSRSHTVSLPFRTRGPPQPEVRRRPVTESKPVDTVSPAVTSGSGIVTAVYNQLDTPSGPGIQSAVYPSDVSVKRPRAQPTATEFSLAVPQLDSRDTRLSPSGCQFVDKREMIQHQQRTMPIVAAAASSYSLRGSHQYYYRDSTGVLEASGSGRQMIQPVLHARDRPTVMSEPRRRMVEPTIRQIPPVSHTPNTDNPSLERSVDKRILPPCPADFPPLQAVEHCFTTPPEHWKEVATDDWRKVRHQVQDHRDPRAAPASIDASYVSPSSYVEPHRVAKDHEHNILRQQYTPVEASHLLPPNQTTSHSVDLRRGWPGQHTDGYRHNVNVVDLPGRESRTSQPHYDMHGRKYTSSEAAMSTFDYSTPPSVSDVQYSRQQPREVQSVGGLEADHYYRRPTPLQPVEPSVRPRIAGLTHGDPAACELALPQHDSGRYPGEHVYRSGRYDRSQPTCDVVTPSDQKQMRQLSPYQSPYRTQSRMLGSGSSVGSFRGESTSCVRTESPLDLTVKKDQSMTAEAFLRRCHDSSQLSSQYTSPGRHATELQYSRFPSHPWTSSNSEAFESADMRRQDTATTGMIIQTESSHPGHVTQWTRDAIKPVRSAMREYPVHSETDVHRLQQVSYPQRRRTDDDDVQMLYARRDVDPRWDSTQPTASSMPASPVVRPAYWDVRHATRAHTDMSQNVSQQRVTASRSDASDVIWIGDRSHYDAHPAELAAISADRQQHYGTEIPATLSPQNVPTAAASRRIPMVQLLGGKYSPNDILHLCCKECGSTYGSLRSFRMHFAKAHGQEPTPENFTIQTISDARIQAMSQRARETTLGDNPPPTLQIESLNAAATSIGRSGSGSVSIDVEQYKRGEFTMNTQNKRSVAEVQPMQKKLSPVVVLDHEPSTPVNKPSLEEAAKRSGEDRRMKCKKCGQFSTQDLSAFRQHVHGSHSDTSNTLSCATCSSEVVDSDTGCAICLEGFNDVSDWQHHVTSQHMMRSCICKSCDLGFTNASALRRHLMASHGGVQSPTGSNIEVEYRCLFCPEVFMDELSLYTHTRAHEQHYSTQRICSSGTQHGVRESAQTWVQMAVPDTTCPEDQRSSAADVTSLDASGGSETSQKGRELEMARKNIEMTDVTGEQKSSTSDVKFNSRKASILRRLSAGMSMCFCVSMSLCACDVGLACMFMLHVCCVCKQYFTANGNKNHGSFHVLN